MRSPVFKPYLLAATSALTLTFFLSEGAAAQSTEELMEIVRRQAAEIEALKKRVDQLERGSTTERNAPAQPPVVAREGEPQSQSTPAPEPESRPEPENAILWKGTPEIRSAHGEWSFKVRGRLQMDAVAYNGDEGSRDFNSGSDFRRARLGVQGTMPGQFKYQAEFDFADGQTAKMEDTFIQYQGFDPLLITVGHHKVYHTLDSATSDLDVTFMERSLMSNAFEAGAGGKFGISAFTSGANWTFHVGLMGDSANNTSPGEDGWGVNSRVTFAPVAEDRRVLHLGASAYTRKETENSVTFGDQPEIRVNGVKLVSSGAIPLRNYQVYGAEAAAVLGSFSVQGEYERAHVNGLGTPDRDFDGAYALASFFLTGESRPYLGNRGYFGRVQPNAVLGESGWGAFEVAARWSVIDLSDRGFGNKERNVTLGLNWYPTGYTRLMFNFVDFDVDAVGPGTAGDDGRAFGVRAQIDW